MWKVCDFNEATGYVARRFSFHSALDAFAYAYTNRLRYRSFAVSVVYTPDGTEVARVCGIH